MTRKLLLSTIFLFLSISLSAIPVTIAIGEQAPLFSPKGGIVNEVISEALKLEGYEVSFEWLPIGRMLKLLENDSLDIYVTPSNTAGQDNPHVILFKARGVFFFKSTNYSTSFATKLSDFAGKRVGTVINSPLSDLFKKAGILVDEGPMESLFAKLDSSRVDFVATADIGGITSILADYPGREGEFDFTDFSYSVIGAGLYAKPSPENAVLLSAVKSGFKKMKNNGSLERLLLAKFGPTHWGKIIISE